jgi:ABC-type transporter Mla subunit MlaD
MNGDIINAQAEIISDVVKDILMELLNETNQISATLREHERRIKNIEKQEDDLR